jgi:hypothetical protein
MRSSETRIRKEKTAFENKWQGFDKSLNHNPGIIFGFFSDSLV